MKATIKTTTALVCAIMLLGACGHVYGQENLPAVWVDVDEVEGLINGIIPTSQKTDLTIPVRFTNVDEARMAISNGYKFTGEGVTWSGISADWNWDYCWTNWLMCDFVPAPEIFFDQGIWVDYFNNGVGLCGLNGTAGTGLPADFDDIAYYITLSEVTGDVGDVLTMDTTWWEPANYWLWSGVGPDVYWAGPYSFMVDFAPLPPPVITSTPVTTVALGSVYAYNVDADGVPPAAYSLIIAPDGMTIDEISGYIAWTPAVSGDFEVEVAATNPYGQDTQQFTIHVFQEAYTYCWPQPTYLKATENDRILEIRIYEEYSNRVDPSSILIQGRLEPINEIRIEDDVIIAECRVFPFIGVSGFRPIPQEGLQTTYIVEYFHTSKGHVTLTGDFAVYVTPGDVNLDGIADLADVQFMNDYFWGHGPECEFEEFMDIDGNGRLDIRDARALLKLTNF